MIYNVHLVEKENGVYKNKNMINRLTLVTEITVDEITDIYEYKKCHNKLVHHWKE